MVDQWVPFPWLKPDTIELLVQGLGVTIILTLLTSLLALVLGVIAAVCWLSKNRLLHLSANVYIEIHRNIPALVLIIFWAFAVPNLFSLPVRRFLLFDNRLVTWLADVTGVPVVYYLLAVILALSFNTSAYIAELFRAGIGTISQEHAEAARSLGASQFSVFWWILLPQGLAAAFPAIATRLIHNMKNTALAAFVAVPELFHGVQTSISQTFHALEFLLLAAALYLALSMLFSLALRAIERRLHNRKQPAEYSPLTQVSHV